MPTSQTASLVADAQSFYFIFPTSVCLHQGNGFSNCWWIWDVFLFFFGGGVRFDFFFSFITIIANGHELLLKRLQNSDGLWKWRERERERVVRSEWCVVMGKLKPREWSTPSVTCFWTSQVSPVWASSLSVHSNGGFKASALKSENARGMFDAFYSNGNEPGSWSP